MDLNKISQSWKSFISKMNSQGVPVPMARWKGQGNPAMTVWLISALLVIVGLIGKAAGHLGGIDMNYAMQFFNASSVLFFGHSWVHKSENGTDTLDGGDGQNKGP